MSEHTAIEWCDSSCNPVMGCSGCELWHPKTGGTCYAAARTALYAGNKGYPQSFEKVTMFEGRAADAVKWKDLRNLDRPNKPWLNGRPRHIFWNDMGDGFSKNVPFEWTYDHCWKHVASEDGRRHVHLFLTKRPHVMVDYEHWMRWNTPTGRPTHAMDMVSITTQDTTRRLTELWKLDPLIPLGLSVEPLLEAVNLMPMFIQCEHREKPVDWIIVGAESGRGARPMELDWVRRIRDVAEEFEIPLFFKQDASGEGDKIHVPELDGKQWTQMPDILQAQPLQGELL